MDDSLLAGDWAGIASWKAEATGILLTENATGLSFGLSAFAI